MQLTEQDQRRQAFPSAGRGPLWIFQALLAVVFLICGAAKLVAPLPLLRVVGAAQVLGACGLIIPTLLRTKLSVSPLEDVGLVIIMIGATVRSLPTGPLVLIPLVAAFLAAFIAYGSWCLVSGRLVR